MDKLGNPALLTLCDWSLDTSENYGAFHLFEVIAPPASLHVALSPLTDASPALPPFPFSLRV